MTDGETITDKRLLTCTIKKSKIVLAKVVLSAAYIIDGLAAGYFALFGLIWIWQVLYPALIRIYTFLLSIPWYFYVGVGVLAAIPMYSFLWCVARELTEEDWRSNAAETAASSALALTPIIPLALTPTITLAIALAASSLAIPLTPTITLAIALAASSLAIALILTFALVEGNSTSRWGYVFKFIGAAYNHYRIKHKQRENQ